VEWYLQGQHMYAEKGNVPFPVCPLSHAKACACDNAVTIPVFNAAATRLTADVL
jgi:hypothetical protein